MKTNYQLPIILALLFLFVFQSCRKDLNKIKKGGWSPNVCLPLLDTKFSIGEILYQGAANDMIDTNAIEPGLITLVYRGNVLSQVGEDIFQIPGFDTSVYVYFPPIGPFVQPVPAIPINSAKGDTLSKVIFKTGTISTSIISDTLSQASATITLTFFNIKSPSGAPLTISVDAGSSNSVDLAGCTATFTDTGLQNALTMTAALSVDTPGGGTFQYSISNISFSYVEGKIRPFNFTAYSDTIPINIYQNWSGSILFAQPKIGVVVNSNFGFPITTQFNTMEVEPQKGGANVPITGTAVTTPVTFNYPSLSEVGQSKQTIFQLDPASVSNAIANSPVNLFYTLSAGLGYGPQNYFILDTCRFSVDVDIELPVWFRTITDIVYTDTFKLDVPSLEDYDYANFKVYSVSTFPFDLAIQLYFFSDTVNLNPVNAIDSLLASSQKILAAGKDVNGDGRVDEPSVSETWIEADEARYTNIQRTRAIVLKARMNTVSNPPDQTVKFFTDYYVRVALGLQSNLNLK